MSDQRYSRIAASVFCLKHRPVWCPKHRRPDLIGEAVTDLQDWLYQKAAELKVEIEVLEIQPDQVHRFVSSAPSKAPQRRARQFKRFSSRILRQKHA